MNNKFIIDGSTLIKYNGNDKIVIIPNDIKKIKGCSFDGCFNLEEIILPNTVEIIDGDCLFRTCIKLKKIKLPESIKTIDEMMFADCNSLEIINIPSSVIKIRRYAFLRCINLKSIYLSSTIKEISVNAFEKCDSLVINYNGTAEEFNKIKFVRSAFDKNKDEIVTLNVDCTDGQFTFNI